MPKLNERIINYDLLKYLAKLQMDPEPGIRTNTTICLGKIARYLNESVSDSYFIYQSLTMVLDKKESVDISIYTKFKR